jgi:hypothetical protein
MSATVTAFDARDPFTAALLACERRQNAVGAEDRTAVRIQHVEDLVRRVPTNQRPAVFRALANGLEAQFVSTALTPEWFADRDRAKARIDKAVSDFRAVLRQVDRRAADDCAAAIDEAIRRSLADAPPLATLQLDDRRVPRSIAHPGGPRRKLGNSFAEKALREVGLTKEYAREILVAAGLRAARRTTV